MEINLEIGKHTDQYVENKNHYISDKIRTEVVNSNINEINLELDLIRDNFSGFQSKTKNMLDDIARNVDSLNF